MKKALSILGLTCILAVVAWNLRQSLLQIPARIITAADDTDEKADLIVILMGGVDDRAIHAAKLYNQGLAPNILYAKEQDHAWSEVGIKINTTDLALKFLKKEGVPEEKSIIIHDSYSRSTFEEAKTVLKYIDEQMPETKSILVVTSWFHSGRAKWIFDRVNETDIDIRWAPTEAPDYWWRYEGSFLNVFNEYVKWLYYLIHY